MIPSFVDSDAALPALVVFLATQQDSILNNWRIACSQDPLVQQTFPLTNPNLFWSVQQHMTQTMAEIIKGVITLYDQLQRSEAAFWVGVLQQALEQLRSLSQAAVIGYKVSSTACSGTYSSSPLGIRSFGYGIGLGSRKPHTTNED